MAEHRSINKIIERIKAHNANSNMARARSAVLMAEGTPSIKQKIRFLNKAVRRFERAQKRYDALGKKDLSEYVQQGIVTHSDFLDLLRLEMMKNHHQECY